MSDYSDENYLTDPDHRTIAGWRRSLDIFAKYPKFFRNGTPSWLVIAAEHDIYYTCYDVTDIPEDSEDGHTLIRLGWHVEDETWACYT